MNLILAKASTGSWILIGVLVALLVVWIVLGATRRKKDEASRRTLESQIIPGAKVKTYAGLYGTVVSVTETTDGKIVLLKTGEGTNVSYQSLHINAIYGLDTKAIVTYDTEGNLVEPAEKPAPQETVAPAKQAKAKKAEVKEEPVKEEAKAEPAKEEKTAEPKEAKADKPRTTKKATTAKSADTKAKTTTKAKKADTKKSTK